MPKRKVRRKRTDCSKCKLERICDKNRHNRKGHCQHFVQCIALGQFIMNILGIDVEEKLNDGNLCRNRIKEMLNETIQEKPMC